MWMTGVDQQPGPATGQFNYYQERVIREAVSQNQQHQWIETISRRKLLALEWAQFIALVALVLALFSLRTSAPLASGAVAAIDQKLSVTPGDASVERGSALVVLARFTGPLPSGAELGV